MNPDNISLRTYRVRRNVERLVSFRLTMDMKDKIDKMADEAGMTRSEFLRLGIETWLRLCGNMPAERTNPSPLMRC